MFRTVGIDENFPRSFVGFNGTLNDGLQIYLIIGALLILVGFVFFIMSIFAFKSTPSAVFFFLVLVLGGFTLKYWKSTLSIRKETYLHGSLIKAKVIEQGRVFAFYKSSKNYSIQAQDLEKNEIYTIEWHNENLWRSAPIGTEILGLRHNNHVLFGHETGCKFQLYIKE